MSNDLEIANARLTNAKTALVDAAKAIDPLAPVRNHPFVAVGVATGIGAVLGMNRGRLTESVHFTRAIASLVRPVMFAVEKYVTANAVRNTTETNTEPARSSAQI